MSGTVRATNRVAQAVVELEIRKVAKSFEDMANGKRRSIDSVTAFDIVKRYGLDFGEYEYDGRLPVSAAEQMVRNHLNAAYKAGRLARSRNRKRPYGSGSMPREFGPYHAAASWPNIWEVHR